MTKRVLLRRHVPIPLLPSARLSILAVTAAFFCTGAETIRDQDLDFQVTIPDGFDRENGEVASNRDLYVFSRAPDLPTQSRTVVRITRLPGTLPPELPMESVIKNGMRFDMEPIPWKTYTLRRARTEMDVGGQRVVILNVQVPLKPKAISINVAGAESDEIELSAIMLGILDSLDGQSNWVSASGSTTTEEKQDAKRGIAGDLIVCLIIAATIGLVIYIRRRGGDNDDPAVSAQHPHKS